MAKSERAPRGAASDRQQDPDPAGFDFFLTAFDPTDLPGGSVDPLGFERGYLFLADKILPGLTNVAGVPRYFSVFCAGTLLARVDDEAPERRLVSARRDAIMVLERLWGLANVLAAGDEPLLGLRGVRYVREELQRLEQKGEKNAEPDYKLLSRQGQYGMLGIYGSVAEELKLVDRKTYTLLADSGEPLGEAFIRETSMPPSVQKAVRREGPVKLETLASWGEAAILSATSNGEAVYLRQAAQHDPVRARMLDLLVAHRPAGDEDELARMARIAFACEARGRDADLAEAMRIVIAYELCYRLSLLAFERILWLCKESIEGPLSPTRVTSDPVMASVVEELPRAVRRLQALLGDQKTAHVGIRPTQLEDALRFLDLAAEAPDPVALLDATIARHREVQQGKFDRGRRKLPWIEEAEGGLTLTTTRVGGFALPVTAIDEIRPHPYRFGAADALAAAARLQ